MRALELILASISSDKLNIYQDQVNIDREAEVMKNLGLFRLTFALPKSASWREGTRIKVFPAESMVISSASPYI